MLRLCALLVLATAAPAAALQTEPPEVIVCPLPGTVPVCTVLQVPPDVSNEGLQRLLCPIAPELCPPG